ncbi:hypothetical protein FOZ61_002096 [Perkinsus olseni]|uniref:Uncharacterized protein n=1 Tax=Perkinsus olseni TaxID=32597 RepID=A0A7J6LV71_PEROL|nr:hypothetical protein FOZ61_002096 [Perkinsus olseni]
MQLLTIIELRSGFVFHEVMLSGLPKQWRATIPKAVPHSPWRSSGQICSGEFATEVEGVRLAYNVDKDGDIKLSAEGPDGRRSRGRSFPLRKGTSHLDPDGFSITNYTVDFGRRSRRRQRSFLRPVSRLLPDANLEEGDLTNLTIADFGIILARLRGQELELNIWNTRSLSRGLFRFRERRGDRNEVTYRIGSDGRVEINVGCRGLDGVSASFSLEEVGDLLRVYFLRSTEGSSIVTFREQVVELCGIGEGADLFEVVLFADEDRIYVPYPIPGRNSALLPLDRIAN